MAAEAKVEYDKAAGTVTMPKDLAFDLLDLAAYPPERAGQYVFGAKVPWTRVQKIRAALDDLGFHWRSVGAKIR